MKKLLYGMMTAVLAFSTGMTMAQAAVSKPAAIASEVQAETSDISLADLKQALADTAVVLLDCNGSKSYAKAHLPGAIDFEAVKTDLAKQLPADKSTLVVAYCGGPRCLAYQAGTAAAAKLGYTNVKHFSGGLSGWKAAGETMESAAVCTKSKRAKGSSACSQADAVKCAKAGTLECPKADAMKCGKAGTPACPKADVSKCAKAGTPECPKVGTTTCDKAETAKCDQSGTAKQKRKDCNRPQTR